MSEYLDQYRDQQLGVIIAPLGKSPDPTYICGFVVNEMSECPRCKLIVEETAPGAPTRGTDHEPTGT